MNHNLRQYRQLQALADRRTAGQRRADVQAWARPARPVAPINTPRRSFGDWLSEQMQVPESHQMAWMIVFSAITLLVGLATIWGLA